MNAIDESLLEQISNLHGIPSGAYNLRRNGELAGRNSTVNIEIISKWRFVNFEIFFTNFGYFGFYKIT